MLSPRSACISRQFAENNQDYQVCSSYVGILSSYNQNGVYALVRICLDNHSLIADVRRISRQEHHRSLVIFSELIQHNAMENNPMNYKAADKLCLIALS